MRLRGLLLVFCLATPAALAAPAPVHLDPKAVAAGEIRTEPLGAVSRAARIGAYGTVLDPARLATASANMKVADAEVAAADAKLKLAQSGAKRAAGLYREHHNISTAELQSAEAGSGVAVANLAVARAKLTALRARLRADWGPVLAKAIDSGAGPLPDLENGTASLVQVSLPLGQALETPPSTATALGPDGARLSLRLLGPSPQVAKGAGQSLFYLASGAAVPIGMPLSVSLPVGNARPGVVVPPTAVVWQGGSAFVFRQTGTDAFAPVAIDPSDNGRDGYFVPGDVGSLHAGDKIAVQGAALLFSEWKAPTSGASAPPAGDDDD